MSLQPKKIKTVGGIPVFQIVHETVQGGFSLDITGLANGENLRAGTPMTYDESTRLAKKANADGSDVKGLLFEDTVIETDASVSVVLRGTVYERRIKNHDGSKQEVPAAIKEKLPLIVFSQSY